MAGVARVPVVVPRVAVEQGISAAAHALNDASTRCDGRHVITGNCNIGCRVTDFPLDKDLDDPLLL